MGILSKRSVISGRCGPRTQKSRLEQVLVLPAHLPHHPFWIMSPRATKVKVDGERGPHVIWGTSNRDISH